MFICCFLFICRDWEVHPVCFPPICADNTSGRVQRLLRGRCSPDCRPAEKPTWCQLCGHWLRCSEQDGVLLWRAKQSDLHQQDRRVGWVLVWHATGCSLSLSLSLSCWCNHYPNIVKQTCPHPWLGVCHTGLCSWDDKAMCCISTSDLCSLSFRVVTMSMTKQCVVSVLVTFVVYHFGLWPWTWQSDVLYQY